MIIYFNSFPRSGASLLRALAGDNFGVLVSEVSDYPASTEHRQLFARNYSELLLNFEEENLLKEEVDLLEMRMWDYFPKGDVKRQKLRIFEPGNKLNKIPGLRKKLAAEPELYVTKTHLRAPDELFPGEFYIYLVRNPYDVLRSYCELSLATRKSSQLPSTLSDLLSGIPVPGVSMSEHVLAVLELQKLYPDQVSLFRYEDVLSNPKIFVKKFGELSRLVVPKEIQKRKKRTLLGGVNYREYRDKSKHFFQPYEIEEINRKCLSIFSLFNYNKVSSKETDSSIYFKKLEEARSNYIKAKVNESKSNKDMLVKMTEEVEFLRHSNRKYRELLVKLTQEIKSLRHSNRKHRELLVKLTQEVQVLQNSEIKGEISINKN